MNPNNLNQSNSKLGILEILSLFVFGCIQFVDFIPFNLNYSNNEPQWLFLSVVSSLLLIVVTFQNKSTILSLIDNLFKSKLFWLYISFLLICTISAVKFINGFEALLTLSRYYISFVLFLILYFSFKNKLHLFIYISYIISLFVFIEAIKGLQYILVNYRLMSVTDLIYTCRLNFDNKNVTSASVLIKLPFVLFALNYVKGFKKIVFYIVFFLATLFVFILSTRALVIGFLIAMVLYLVVSLIKKNSSFFNLIIITAIVLVNLGLAFNIIKNGKQNSGALVERNLTVGIQDESLQVRFNFWKSSFQEMAKNPILGCGVGNWKLASIPYEHQWKKGYIYGVHMHNDFLEVAAETGILNGFIFLSLFIMIFFINIKNIFKSNNELQVYISTSLLLVLVIYVFDTMFNFPLSRATVQIFLSMLLAFTILNHEMNTEPTDRKNNVFQKIFLAIVLLLSLSTIYPNNLQVDFFKVVNVINKDKYTNLDYKSVNEMLPKIPNLDETTTPTDFFRAKYLLKERRYDEALVVINRIPKQNPHTLQNVLLKIELFSLTKQTDSVAFYNKFLIKSMPQNISFYKDCIKNLGYLRDTTQILTVYNELALENKTVAHYTNTYDCLSNSGYSISKSIKILNDGLQKFPNDTILKRYRKEAENYKKEAKDKPKTGGMNYNKILQELLQSVKDRPGELALYENIGICYYELKQYKEALPYSLKVVNSNLFIDGKSEHIAALCYYFLKDNTNACSLAQKSLAKGFLPEMNNQIIKETCK